MVMDLNLDAARIALRKDMLEEAAGRSLPELYEPGWQDMWGGNDSQLTNLDRQRVNDEARRYYYTDPLTHYMVNLHSAYTFGQGATLRGMDKDVNAWVQEVWNSPRNRASISRVRPQHALSRDLQLDGEVFLAFYTSTITGHVTIRRIPAQQIERVVHYPGDQDMPLYFIRRYTNAAGEQITQRIADYRVADMSGRVPRLMGSDHTEVAMMHIVSNGFNGRGISELTPVIPWIKATKGFMEDRATLSIALATFAFKAKIRGNRQAAQRIANQLGGYETTDRYGSMSADGKERRQGANTFIGNDAIDLEQMKTDSGASNAYQDMRMFKQMSGIGHGVFEHYLGDPSTGNLATSLAMELPMLKLFEFGQKAWGDSLSEAGGYIVLQGLRYGALRNSEYDIDSSSGIPMWVVRPRGDVDLEVKSIFPPIIQKDIAVWSSALAQVAQTETMAGHMVMPPEVKAENALRMFGNTTNVGEMIDQMKEDGQLDVNRPTEVPDQKQNPAEDEENPQENDDDGVTESSLSEPMAEADQRNEIRKALRITKADKQKALDDFKNMPTLEELAKSLGMTLEELDDA